MENAVFLPVAFEVILLAGALLVLLVAVVAGRSRKVWGPIAGVAFLKIRYLTYIVFPQSESLSFIGGVYWNTRISI